MHKLKTLLVFILIISTSHILLADLNYVSGKVVNGRESNEKCDNVKVNLIINSQTQATAYTDEDGYFIFNLSGINSESTPSDFELEQNYPNPFNQSTTLPYSLEYPGEVKLDIYDLRGHKVRSLVHESLTAGYYYPRWDGRNDNMQLCPQGMYFYVLSMNGKTEIRKMTFTNSRVMAKALPVLAKSSDEQTVEIEISDRDIENKTFTYNYSELPSTLDCGDLQIHVYAHFKDQPESIYAMEGEDARDTLDVYFERPFTLDSDDVDVEWEFTDDSLVAVHYTNIIESPVVLRLNEPGEAKNMYVRAYFDIDARPTIWPTQLRRAFTGIAYSRKVQIEENQGEVHLTLTSVLPSTLSLNGLFIEGTPDTKFEDMVYFTIEDDREIPVQDSALLIIDEYDSVSFNDYVVDVLREYHRDGRYPYKLVSGYHGVTEDLFYKGSKIAKANSDSSHSTYCCGLTFEVYFKAISRLQSDMAMGEDINGMTASNFSSFISKWFVQSTLGDGPGIALDSYGMGEKIPKMKDVQKGDFVQIWRTTGSGHSVIFINWTTNAAGDTTGMQYWSTQTSTNGANYNTEYFDGLGGTIDKAHTYYSRGWKPEYFEDF